MGADNVINLEEWKGRDTAKLLEYLTARLRLGDLPGIMVQSLDRQGRERAHIAGVYKDDASKAASAALGLSVRMTTIAGSRDDDG